MVTTLVSLLTGTPVKALLAMTGEVTLSGKVLPVGGIKEKVLAAHRFGVRDVILPQANYRNVREDLPPEVTRNLKFHFVRSIPEVLEVALNIKLSTHSKSAGDPKVAKGRLGSGPAIGNLN
jgi:ATP-dependent Lon protease